MKRANIDSNSRRFILDLELPVGFDHAKLLQTLAAVCKDRGVLDIHTWNVRIGDSHVTTGP